MKFIKRVLKKLGPGFITGAADDDPAGIGTYSMAGSRFGYSTLWTPFFIFPLMVAVQEVCARVSMVTGEGLAGVIKKHYGRKVLLFCVFLLFGANAINIGANIGAMASSIRLILPVSFAVAAVTIAVLSVALQLLLPYRIYSRFLKWLALSLLSYIVVSFVIKHDWILVLQSIFKPRLEFSFDYLLILVAILGTTISPYLFFWQASGEVEEERSNGRYEVESRLGATRQEIKDMRADVIVGMIISTTVMFFIILTTAGTLFRNGVFNIETAHDAALALQPFAGNFAFLLFALGIVGVGLLANPVLAGSASYAVSETLGFKEGLSLKFREAKGFYGVIALATLLGLLFNFVGINPFKALLYSAVLNGLIAPPFLYLILRVSGNRKIMGNHANGPITKFLGWLTFFLMAGAGILLIGSFII